MAHRLFGGSSFGGGRQRSPTYLGPLLYPSVPLWSVFASALKGVTRRSPGESPQPLPCVVILDLLTLMHPPTPPLASMPDFILEIEELVSPAWATHRSTLLPLDDLIAEEEHEVSLCHRRA